MCYNVIKSTLLNCKLTILPLYQVLGLFYDFIGISFLMKNNEHFKTVCDIPEIP